MRILAAIDGSKHATTAIDWIKQLGQTSNPSAFDITLVHVMRPMQAIASAEAGLVLPADPEVIESQRQASTKLLVETKANLEQAGFTVHTVQREGHPGERICQTASEKNIDLIVVGSRGLGSIGETLLGSVSHYVTHHASCPVTIVKMAPPATDSKITA